MRCLTLKQGAAILRMIEYFFTSYFPIPNSSWPMLHLRGPTTRTNVCTRSRQGDNPNPGWASLSPLNCYSLVSAWPCRSQLKGMGPHSHRREDPGWNMWAGGGGLGLAPGMEPGVSPTGAPLSAQETKSGLNIDSPAQSQPGWGSLPFRARLSASSGKLRLPGLWPHLLPAARGRREAVTAARRGNLRSRLVCLSAGLGCLSLAGSGKQRDEPLCPGKCS